ncbi:MAG TPA: glycosyltransferase family 4 protein [Blastocatellia bacterium]|nr:glycosyltransferase family 4 protein [Blastocatellia bacterium]
MTIGRKRRLISIAHSYCVALNRRLAHEMALAGGGNWEVTAVAPSFFYGDLRPVRLETFPGEASHLKAVPVRFSRRIHAMLYGRQLRAILDDDWDVVHCWEEPFIFAGGQVARWSPAKAALVYATFQNIAKHYPPPFNWIERYSMSRASGWIAFGETIEQTLISRPCYLSKARRVIPLGVDLTRFYPDTKARSEIRTRLGWDEGGPAVAGYLGRFVSEKGLHLLTRALDRVCAPWRALFVGAGPLERHLRSWAARHGERVRIVSGVRHDQVPAYINSMDLMCAPSQTTPQWREQLGRMLIEAFACGVPVVASDSGEIPYVVGDSGIVVGESDERGWARAIEELIGDSSRRAELANRGLDRARSTYVWPVVAKEHLAFFDELLSK